MAIACHSLDVYKLTLKCASMMKSSKSRKQCHYQLSRTVIKQLIWTAGMSSMIEVLSLQQLNTSQKDNK